MSYLWTVSATMFGISALLELISGNWQMVIPDLASMIMAINLIFYTLPTNEPQ